MFPESFDERVLRAIPTILTEGTAQPILLGKRAELEKKTKEKEIPIDWDRVSVIDSSDGEKFEEFSQRYFDIRNGAVTKEQAYEAVTKDINIFGTLMVETDWVDGMISGANCSTAQTIRPAIQIIKTKEKFHKVSGFFFMILEERVLLFADCAVIIEPNSHELADIAIDTATTAIKFGIEPKIAMLSFSTHGSGDHPNVDKVREATKMAQAKRPDLIIEGEMQVDAALVPEVCLKKFPTAKSMGDYNVLIFPDLQSGNIAYKLVQRLAGATAIGPVYQGLNKPVNDLSRGCSSQDIIDLAAITTLEAQNLEKVF